MLSEIVCLSQKALGCHTCRELELNMPPLDLAQVGLSTNSPDTSTYSQQEGFTRVKVDAACACIPLNRVEAPSGIIDHAAIPGCAPRRKPQIGIRFLAPRSRRCSLLPQTPKDLITSILCPRTLRTPLVQLTKQFRTCPICIFPVGPNVDFHFAKSLYMRCCCRRCKAEEWKRQLQQEVKVRFEAAPGSILDDKTCTQLTKTRKRHKN